MSGFDNQFRTDQHIAQQNQFYDSQRYNSDARMGQAINNLPGQMQQIMVQKQNMQHQALQDELIKSKISSDLRMQEVAIQMQTNESKIAQMRSIDELDMSRIGVESARLGLEEARLRINEAKKRMEDAPDAATKMATTMWGIGGGAAFWNRQGLTLDPSGKMRPMTDKEKEDYKNSPDLEQVKEMRLQQGMQLDSQKFQLEREQFEQGASLGSAKMAQSESQFSTRSRQENAKLISEVLARDIDGMPKFSEKAARATLKEAGIEITPDLETAISELGQNTMPSMGGDTAQPNGPNPVLDFAKKITQGLQGNDLVAQSIAVANGQQDSPTMLAQKYMRHQKQITSMWLAANANHQRAMKDGTLTQEMIDDRIAALLRSQEPHLQEKRQVFIEILKRLK